MFSSSQNLQLNKDLPNLNENHRKEKRIRKRKNTRNNIAVTQASNGMNELEEFISKNGKQYFSLSQDEKSTHFCYNFKTSVHVRNIIGHEKNVYSIKKAQNTVTDAYQYLRLIKNRQNGKVSKVLLSNQNTKKAFKYINICNRQHRKVLLLDNEESKLLAKRNQMHQEMQNFFIENMGNQGAELDILTKEMLSLCKLNSVEENQIVQKIYSLANNNSDILHKLHEDNLQVFEGFEDNYLSCLVRKNLVKGLEQVPIDMLNYFNVVQSQEKSLQNDQSLRLCNSLESFKCYLKLKKPRIGKSADQSLKTCCSACFSNYYEVMNPIQTCSQCGMRMHKLCQPIRSKCQRCKYIRKTLQQKSSIPYCLVCQRQKQQNIAIEFIYDGQKQYYAHTFCLLTNNAWTFRNKQTHYEIPRSQSDIIQTCKICKTANKFCISCRCCSRTVHGLCAFLEGYSLNLSRGNRLEITSCKEDSDKIKLSLLRKFKMNYEKMLYKNTEELFSMMKRDQ